MTEFNELVPDNVSDKDVKDEANRRAAKCGYCDRNGDPPGRTKIMSLPSTRQYEEGYRRVFGHD